MTRSMILFVLTVCLPFSMTEAHEHASHEQDDVADVADFAFDAADRTVPAEMLVEPLAYDADILAQGDRFWYAWLEFVPERGDEIWVGCRQGATWQWKRRIEVEPGEYAAPTLTRDLAGRVWLSYEARSRDQWDILLAPLDEAGQAGAVLRVSPGEGADIHHRAVASDDGPWIVWQSDRSGQFDVVARSCRADQLGPLMVVGHSDQGDWHPSIAVDSTGKVYVTWDAYDGESFNVYLRAFDGKDWGNRVDVACSPAFEGRADLAIDQSDRVWMAWEEGGVNWGKPFRGINTEGISDEIGPLHRFRMIRLAVVDPSGSVRRLADPFPMPAIDAAHSRNGRQPGVEQTGAFYERVKLVIDSNNCPWLTYRHYYTPWLGVAHRSHVQEGWGVFARSYTADGWSELVRMSIGQGDGLQRLEVVSHPQGLAGVWTTGRTHRTADDRPRGLACAVWDAESAAPDTPALDQVDSASYQRPADDVSATPQITVGGKTYSLFYGDLHRHTDLSLCRVPIDGTIDDAYRYAIDVAQLDFLGITDHSRDIAQGDPLSQLWWRSRKEVYRHQLMAGAQMTFVPFYAYERSHGNTADHNVISLRGDMLRPYTYPVPVFWQELDVDTMTIPHQPVRRDTWAYQNDELRPLVEIYQGCRDTAIGQDVHEGLARGYHSGFIASSDHMSTSASYACVWAEQPTRVAIFRALQARRTFAATDKIWLTVLADDQWMGAIYRGEESPRLTLQARGTAPIRSVELVVDGQIHKTYSPDQVVVEIEETLQLTGQHYVYFHLLQRDGNQAWSSPIWISLNE